MENGEQVVVKVLKDVEEETEKTFRAEISAAEIEHHPHVLQLFNAGRSQIM